MGLKQIKLDYDFISLRKVIKTLVPAWRHIAAAKNLRLAGTDAYMTAHGWHIYLFITNPIKFEELLLIECLLGSDIKKQRYAYAEGHDILFKYKQGRQEQYDYAASKKINGLLLLNESFTKVKIKMPKKSNSKVFKGAKSSTNRLFNSKV